VEEKRAASTERREEEGAAWSQLGETARRQAQEAATAALRDAERARREGDPMGEVRSALSVLDQRLLETLHCGAIRLVRSKWLLESGVERMPYRQQLEEMEKEVEEKGESPLLSPAEAMSLVARGDRSVGSLTYGWPSAGHPDPEGVRLREVRRVLAAKKHIAAIFWDYASLHQHPPNGKRSDEEGALFGLALKAMGGVYASAVGTTVLQIKEIPRRPQGFDGALCLFGLAADADEASIRKGLEEFGEITSCVVASRDLGHVPTVVVAQLARSQHRVLLRPRPPGLGEGFNRLPPSAALLLLLPLPCASERRGWR